ncbi:19309_t:CDS:10 [Funneliformis geosporum]|nr:19309_t:CDS:10 [Funneliformis geosporum]
MDNEITTKSTITLLRNVLYFYLILKRKKKINSDASVSKNKHQIAISRDGKLAVTFDSENHVVKVFENTDYRKFSINKKQKIHTSQEGLEQNKTDLTHEINKTIATFKINDDLTFKKFGTVHDQSDIVPLKNNNQFRWSLDISSMRKYHVEYIVNVPDKRTAIYCLKLDQYHAVDSKFIRAYNLKNLSGICRFIEDTKSEGYNECILKRFIVMNINGIYNFEYILGSNGFNNNERFSYPKIFEEELKDWYDDEGIPDCMDRLLSCIYDKYFLVEYYKNNLQFLEVFDLVEMKLESNIKRKESMEKHLRKYNKYSYSIDKQKLQLCFARGQSIRIYFMESGLEISYRLFEKIKKIHLIEFIDGDEKLLIVYSDEEKNQKLIIWDLYNTDMVKTFPLCENTHLARTSGNLLQVDDNGKVTSVLKMIDNELRKKTKKEIDDQNFLEYTAEIEKDPILNEGEISQERHTVFSYEEKSKPLINETEPWVMDYYDETSFYLFNDEIEVLQLIIGRTTVQIWHKFFSDPKNKVKEKEKLPNEGKPFLEFIWTNGIPINQENKENRLRINKHIFGPKYFYLEIYWYENNSREEVDEINMEENMKAMKEIKGKYEEMIMYINHIVWRYIIQKPDQYRLLDVRHNVMKNLILGDCDLLIKFILFGNNSNDNEAKEEENFQVKHIPRSRSWQKKHKYIRDDDINPFNRNKKIKDHENIVPGNDLELAIYHCRDHEQKDTIVVAYLLEYYSSHAKDHVGWMVTVSTALPLLYKYNYDNYARRLFHKECFANQNYFLAQDPYDIIPEEFLERRNNDAKFRAFRPIIDLQSAKENALYNYINKIKHNIAGWFENFDNDHGKPPLALRVVPLPEFTVNKIKKKEEEYTVWKIILNIFLFMIVPRLYKINRKEKNLLSPFSRVVQYENCDDMFNNPAIEAVIDFRWKKTKNYIFIHFLRFLCFGICFGYISWEYMNNNIDNKELQKFLATLIVLFYYLAIHLLVTEAIQLHYRGCRRYFCSILDKFDLISVLLPVIVITVILVETFHFSNGFESVKKVDSQIVVGISFSMLVIWIETILYLHLISRIATYIYYVIIIIQSVLPFLIFTFIVIFAFAHTLFLLLKDPEQAGIRTKDATASGFAINDITKESFEINLKSDFNPTDRNDNPFSSFSTSIEAAYYWINGDYVQRDLFDSWIVKVFTFMASIFIVIILQNMLIAFMGGVYEETVTKGRQALLRYRANQIADYEALCHIHLWPHESDPKYIHYIGQSKNFENWHKSRKEDQGTIYKDFEEPPTFIKNAFKRSTYDEYSIWQFENKDENDKKGKSTEIIPTTEEVGEVQVDVGKSDDAKRKTQVDAAKLIQEIEKLKINLSSIECSLNEFKNQKFQE